MSRVLRLAWFGLGMVVSASSVPPNSAWAEGNAGELVVAAEPPSPATIATTPTPLPTPPVLATPPRPFNLPAPVPTETAFYGWQNIVAGHVSLGATLLIGLLGDGSGSSEAAGFIGLSYLLGSPIIHAVHGDGTRALGAAGILAGIPATLALTGFAIDEACGDGSSCTGSTWAFGLLAGLVIAPIVDGVALGWEEVPVEAEESPDVTFMPVVNARFERGAESLSLGIGGNF